MPNFIIAHATYRLLLQLFFFINILQKNKELMSELVISDLHMTPTIQVQCCVEQNWSEQLIKQSKMIND